MTSPSTENIHSFSEDIYILPDVSEINEKDNVPTNYYFGMIRNTEKKLYCLDKDENLDVS